VKRLKNVDDILSRFHTISAACDRRPDGFGIAESRYHSSAMLTATKNQKKIVSCNFSRSFL